MRLAGNIIWAQDIKEVSKVHTETYATTSGGKGGGGHTEEVTNTTISYSYYVTLAIAICEGSIDEIIRIWADSMLIGDEKLRHEDQGKFNLHLGTEDQIPDSIIGKYKQAGTYPAYRGLAYVVIEDFPLAKFGNRIPNFSFEVKKDARFYPAVEDKIKEVILIPGSGEFVYGDKIYYRKFYHDSFNEIESYKHPINMCNYNGVPNMVLAVEQMMKTLPNLEWVGLVVTWFATSTNAANCRIVPKIEVKQGNCRISPLLDILINPVVQDINIETLPENVKTGDLYIINNKPNDSLKDYAGQLILKEEHEWQIIPITKWMRVTLDSNGNQYQFNGEAWVDTTPKALEPPTPPSQIAQEPSGCLIKANGNEESLSAISSKSIHTIIQEEIDDKIKIYLEKSIEKTVQ